MKTGVSSLLRRPMQNTSRPPGRPIRTATLVTAYSTAGLESDYSNEVSKTNAYAPAPPKGLRIWIVEAIAWLMRHVKFWV